MFDFLTPRLEVTSMTLGNKLTEFYFQATKSWDRTLLQGINRNGGGELLYQAIEDELENLLLFTIAFTVRTTVPQPHNQSVLKYFSMYRGEQHEGVKHYYESLALLDDGKLLSFRKASQEYLVVGKAFMDKCTRGTENREFNMLLRQIGCEIFGGMTEATKKFLKSYKVTA